MFTAASWAICKQWRQADPEYLQFVFRNSNHNSMPPKRIELHINFMAFHEPVPHWCTNAGQGGEEGAAAAAAAVEQSVLSARAASKLCVKL